MIAIIRFLLRLLFGFRAFNPEVLKTPGPVLLIPNHVSWIDWLLLGVWLDKDWRFVTSLEMVNKGQPWMRFIIDNKRTFPVDTRSPYAVRRMAEYLENGGRLVLFSEGRLSRTGTLMKLFDGTGFLLHKTGAKVITAYLRGAQRLLVSPNRERKQWRPKVTVHFGEVLTAPKVENLSTAKARTLVTNWLRDRMVEQQFETEMTFGSATVPEALIDTARRQPNEIALEDINGKLAYRRLLMGADLLARQWSNLLGDGQGDKALVEPAQKSAADPSPPPGENERVGVLLPNVNTMPVTLLSLWLLGKVPAILNYSTGVPTMLTCAGLAGLKRIITSRTFLERAKIPAEPFADAGIELLFLEEVRQRITGAQKVGAYLRQRCLPPTSILRQRQSAASTAVILFTSGSEGMPKGVELTHANLLANIRQVLAVADIQETDRVFNALPLFHSFGLAMGSLMPLIRGIFVFLYPSPLHYRVVPTIFYDRDCTILLGTNTFLNGYARKAHAYDFRSLRYLFAGAEKLQETTAQTWAQKYGVRILEGYGATECGPVISVCTPMQPKHGSTGRFLPAMNYRIEPVEGVTHEEHSPSPDAAAEKSAIRHRPSPRETGRLFVKGPNVMKGYLNPDANAKFQSLEGWYDTGDIVSVDAGGFITIEGRMKRFAKISGEMVSLTAVEDALAGAFPHYGLRCQIAVISRPDPDKGEVLVAVSNESNLRMDEMRAAIRAKGLPNLCVPRELKFVKDIPKLGTGKVNHRELASLIE